MNMNQDIPCPTCGTIIEVHVETEHVFDHVMECQGCYDAAVDYIFSQFVQDGFAMNSSFIRQTFKYLIEHLHEKLDELENEEEPHDHI